MTKFSNDVIRTIDKGERGASRTITEINLQKHKQHNNNNFVFENINQSKDKLTQQNTEIDLNNIKKLEKAFYKNSGEPPKSNLKDAIAKVAEYGYRGVEALVRHPFSPHPLGRQNSEVEDTQLTQSDHETRLMNHGLAFQFQDGFEKAASFHFADSEAFQKAKDLTLGSIAKIDNVHRKKNYLLETLGNETTLDADNRIERVQQYLEIIKELKTDINMTLQNQTLKLRIAKFKIQEYADTINKQAGGIKNKLRSISETKQLVETLSEHVGASEPLETLKKNLETYEKALESTTLVEEKFSKDIRDAFNSNIPHKIVDSLKKLELDAKKLVEAEGKARKALSDFNKNCTNEQKSDVEQALKQYIDSLRKETQDKFAESLQQIEKIEQKFKERVQEDEKAATVAHLIVERSQQRVSVNGVWVDVREIDSLDFSKAGQTTVSWRPDIPEILIKKAHDVESGQKLIEDKILQDIYAKRIGKVEKSTGLGTCTFEISDSDFRKFSTPNRDAGRRKAVLTMKYTKDHNDKPLDPVYEPIIEIEDIEKMQIAPSKTDEKKDGNVTIITETYKFPYNDKNVAVTLKEETTLDTRARGDGSERKETRKVTQTQVVEDKKGKKRISIKNYRLTKTIEKNGFVSRKDIDLYKEFSNSEGEVVKSIHEMPTETLKSITIDLSTTNRRMLAESMVSIETKTLPDSPIIYHSEVRANPEIDLRQMDRINLIAKKLYLRNGRTMNLDPAKPKAPDWLKTKDERTYVPGCGLVFQLTGPTRSHLVPLNYAGSDLLFTQQDKDKEKELIATVEKNQKKLLEDLKQSIDLASSSIGSDTFDPEILQKAFRTAEMCDNEINRQIALNKEMVMNPPENRNDLAQLMKSREAFQRDAAMPKTVDGNSEQTRKMTEDAKNFCQGLVDAITDKGKESELLTQIVADQQGLEKLVEYDEYYHKLSLIDNKTLDLIDVSKEIFDTDDGKKIFGLTEEDDSKSFDLTNPVTAAKIRKISEKMKKKIPELTEKIDAKITGLTGEIQKKISGLQKEMSNSNEIIVNIIKEASEEDNKFWKNIQNITKDLKDLKDGINSAKEQMKHLSDGERTKIIDPTHQEIEKHTQHMEEIEKKAKEIVMDGERTKIIDPTHQEIEKLLEKHTQHMEEIEKKAKEIATQFNKTTAIDNIKKLQGVIPKDVKQFEEQLTKLTEAMDKAANTIAAELAVDDMNKAANTIIDDNKRFLGSTYRVSTMIKDLTAREEKVSQVIKCTKKIEQFFKKSQEEIAKRGEKNQQLTKDAVKLNVLAKYADKPETATENDENIKEFLTQEGAKRLEALSQSTEPTKLLEETKKLIIHKEQIQLLDKITKVIDSENIQNFTETLDDLKKNSKYIENGNKFIDGAYEHANQIADVMHLISNMKKIEADIDNSSDLYAKNWLNLKRAKAAADHNKFEDIEEAKVSTTISKEAAAHHKNWLIIRNAIENKGIKGVYSYIKSLKAPTLSNINSLKGAREASEYSWVKYLENAENQACGDYASIKVALSKTEYIRQYIDKNEKIAQDMISQEVLPEERQKRMLDKMQDIDETFLITPARPKLSRDSLASMQPQKDDNFTFNSDVLRNKSPEQLSRELRFLTGKDLEYAMKDVGKLIEQTDDPILKEIYRKNAPEMALAMAKNASELRKQLLEIQDWWQRRPELKEQQKRQFWMSLIEAFMIQVTSGQRYMNDGLGRMNSKIVNDIVG